eukprot:scaffold21942_cov101-Isochrysis_galbana.AAC.3
MGARSARAAVCGKAILRASCAKGSGVSPRPCSSTSKLRAPAEGTNMLAGNPHSASASALGAPGSLRHTQREPLPLVSRCRSSSIARRSQKR